MATKQKVDEAPETTKVVPKVMSAKAPTHPPTKTPPETAGAKAARIYKRAIALHQAGNVGDAIKGYAIALKLSPKSSEIYNNLGVAMRAVGRPQAALACYRRSLSIAPGSASVYTNMGNALHDTKAYDRAVQAHLRAVKFAPKSAKIQYGAGRALADLGQNKEALKHFVEALKLQKDYPEARFEYAKAVLRSGDWATGFKHFGARVHLPKQDPRRKGIDVWDGSSLDGKTILVNYEGDEGALVQYLRFVRLLKKKGARVLVESPPYFNQLLSASADIDGTPNPGADVDGVDVQIPLLSLPRAFGVTVENIPAAEGYLPLPLFTGQKIEIQLGMRLVVGLVWSGNWAGRSASGPEQPGDVKLEDLAELFGIEGVQLVSLELGLGTKDIDELGFQPLMDQAGSAIMDVADMAGIIDQLDLLICVDSVAAHVAGAMGKPVWMLTRPGANWGWLEGRDDSPWYASLSLFRKGPDQDWTDVVSSIRQALMTILKGAA